MANKREFKKDVNFLTNEIIMRGMVHLEFFGQKDAEKVYEIINEAVVVRNNYIERINQRLKDKSAKEVKGHFKSIYDDLLNSTHNLLERIDNLDVIV